jgi:hypothetical protein
LSNARQRETHLQEMPMTADVDVHVVILYCLGLDLKNGSARIKRPLTGRPIQHVDL